jgi:hypothetical protein
MQFLIVTKNKGGILNVEKDCAKCENKVTDGVCCGSEENELIDTTGEKKCFKPDFLARMEEEGKELAERIRKANAYLLEKTEKYVEDPENTGRNSNIALDLLQAQTTAMATYLNILLLRVNIERSERGLPTIAQF